MFGASLANFTMARTKRVTKPAAEKKGNPNTKIKELILKKIEEQEQTVMNELDKRMEKDLELIKNEYLTLRIKFSKAVLNRTMAEIKNGEVDDNVTVLSDLTNTFNSTKTIANSTTTSKKGSTRNITNSTVSSSDGSDRTKVSRPSRARAKRSVSAGCDDEGYTTAESVRGTTSGGRHNSATRASRSRLKVAKQSSSSSRSLSRTAAKKLESFQTPANKQPPSGNAGTITPKCKPNTPLLCVRRPKIGEMAWSNQGSPLMVSSTVAPEQTANINIPVGDDILSMLPTRGPIRVSQIPDVGHETRKQLEILRDNLINYIDQIGKK